MTAAAMEAPAEAKQAPEGHAPKPLPFGHTVNDVVYENLQQAGATLTVVSNIFQNVDHETDESESGMVVSALFFAERLLGEAADSAVAANVAAGRWYEDLSAAANLLTALRVVIEQDGGVILFSAPVMSSYLWAVSTAIERASEGWDKRCEEGRA